MAILVTLNFWKIGVGNLGRLESDILPLTLQPCLSRTAGWFGVTNILVNQCLMSLVFMVRMLSDVYVYQVHFLFWYVFLNGICENIVSAVGFGSILIKHV